MAMLRKFRSFLFGLFWIDRFKRLAQTRKGWQYKFMYFYAWMALGVYVVGLLLSFPGMLLSPYIPGLLGWALGLLMFRSLVIRVAKIKGLPLE